MSADAVANRLVLFEIALRNADPATFGLPVSNVSQVIEADVVVAVPLAPAVVVGILNHHGRIITVVEPAHILGLSTTDHPVTNLVVLRRSDASSGNIGLRVLRVREIVPASWLETVDVTAGEHIARVAQQNNRLVHIIDATSFIEGLRCEFAPEGRRDRLGKERQGAGL